MIVRQKSKVIPIEKSSTHYKMYKGGKLWLTAGITTLSMAGMMVAAGELQTAHADTTTTANNTQQTATGGNAVTATTSGTSGQAGTITQPVNVDHSQLNNAVDQARQAGLTVNQQPTTTQTVSQGQVDAAKQNIQNDETKQAQRIQTITRQHQTEVSNVNNFNGSKGDTSQLDARVKEAQSIPGLTVVHDQDQTTVKKASDTQGIQEAVNNATQSNNDQAQSIQNAIDTQKRNNQEYQEKMGQQTQTNQGQSAIKTNYVYPGQQVPIFKSYANQKIIVSGSNCSISNGDILSWDDWANGRGKFKHAYNLNTNSVVTATVEDAAIDNATGKSLNLHLTFSDFHFIPDSMQDYSGNPNQVDNHKTFLSFLIPAGGGLIAADTNNISTFVVKQSFTYADGTPYQGKSLMYVSSLDNYKTVDHAEFIHPQSGVEAAFVPNGSSILTNQQALHGTAASIANEGYIMPPIEEYPDNMKDSSIIFLANAESSYVMGIDNPRGGDVIATLPNGLKNNDGQAITFGANALQVQYPKTSSIHYHYNTVMVPKTTIGDQPVNYQLHDLNVKTTPEKNWVNGIQSVNNKVGINDDVVTTKVDMNYLGSNQIEGGLHSLKVTDDYSKFANNVDYAGAQVYENEELATGNYDITNNGQQVTATRKNPESANGGKVSLVIDFKIKPNVKTGTVFENSGSGTINDQTVPTNDAQIKTYEQETVKHWMEGKNIVDDKTEINGDIVTTQVHMTLPDQSTLIAPLSYVSIDDNYTDFADKTNLLSYQLWENGANVTDQYNITNENGHLTAVRKNASAAPAGEVVLIGTFKINDNVLNGTKLVNRGSGRLNNHTVETNTPAIVTFTQSVDKHWVEGSNTVDTKTYIADDVATTNITTTLPDPNSLAKPLTYLSIDDDYTNFMDKAKLQSYQVWEGNSNVTSEYTVTDNNGHLTARRNDPSKAPGGTLRLVAVWKINDNVPSGTKLVNTGSSRINNHTVEAGKPYVVVYTQTTDKHWVDGNQVVDDKTYVDGDNVNGQVTMSLPNPSDLAKPLSNVIIRDDYTKFANDVDYKSATVTENDKDATDQYNIVNENGVVTATRKDPGAAPAGKVQLNVIWTTHTGLPSGTKLVNSGSGTINGKTVNTPDRTIYTFHNDSDKHWVEGNRKVDGLTRINDDLIHAEISTALPDPSQLAKKLGEIQLVDDWSDFKDKAKVTSYRVTENDKDATDQYNVVVDNNGFVTATRKDASSAPGGVAKLLVDWKINHDVASGTKLRNTGYTLINKSRVEVPTVDTVTFTPKTDKHWVEGNQDVDDKTYVAGDEVHGNVSMTLPEPEQLAKPLSKIIVIDDYRNFMDKVTYEGANVYEGDKDVTSLYDVKNENGIVTATRKDASSAPGGIVYLKANWKLNTAIPNGTVLTNRGLGQINDDLVPTPDRNIYVFTQTAEKHWKAGDQDVDSKTVINDDVIHSEVSMSLPEPNSLAKSLEDVEIEDDYSDFKDKVGLPTVKLYENGQDASAEYNVTLKDGVITAVRKDPSKAPAGTLTMNVTWKVNHDVASGTKFTNKGTGIINRSRVKTNTPDVVTFTPETDKHWTNDNDQSVDNMVFIAGDNVSSKVSMSLPEPQNLAEKLKKVQVIDNFADFADKVDLKGYSITENGKDANDLYNFEVTKDHQIIATRKDPATTPGGLVILRAQWTLHKDVPTGTVLTNKGSGQINDDLVPTPDRQIKTYTQDTDKHWVNNGGQVVDNKLAINDGIVTARVDMTLPKSSTLGSKIHKIQLTDDFSKFAKDVEVQGVHVFEGDKDVTDQYDISIDPNGKVVATRKDPSKVNNHQGELPVTMQAVMNAKDSLDTNNLVTKATGNLNNNLFAARAGLFNASFIQTHVSSANGKINSQVDMQLPETSEGVNKVAVTDDYTNFSKYAQPGAVHVYEDGKEATANYTVSDDGAGHVTATRNDTENLNGGQVSMKVDYKIKGDIPNGTVLENHGSGTINDETIPTNTPSITTYTQEAEKHWVEDDQIVDGRVVIDGSVAHAKVTTTLPDPSQLTDPLTNMSIKDDYSKFAKDVDLTDVQVLENGKLATSEYNLEKGDGFVIATRKDPTKTPGGNAQLLLTFNIHKDVPSGTKLENAGSSTINNHTVKTNTPWIETFLPNPTKDVVISVDNQKSLNGQKIELGQHFDYKLIGSQLPASVTALNEYGFHDDYDETHDQYNAGYTVLLNDDITLKDGTVLKKNTDVTKYTTQVVDTENGKVDIEFDKNFLANVDLSKSSFGATAYLKMKRVKSGTVQNKYTNSINNIDFSSNTVTTTTEEPKKPETPPTTPKKPETPVTPTETPKTTPTPTPAPQVTPVQEPVMAAVATPAQVATPVPQQPSSAAPQEALPQTGNANESGLVVAGLAGFLVSLGAFSLKKKRN
ncbi:LPXTG cell wall anchor domain-containing protein [Limosilactobacillus reuteri]|uniref:LPXTG cell wall anchor domain-containing protein n=1 Tax=Limosilactobacillus reuteri TaxID=1598 RepID=UPI001E2952B9|nr:LPXTG cell wall anchor domain-containing protein [Limosilactobacillus reuteri]MCC4359277.1 LPXTG cell wall anchor domain-containing protein [Limosilactobacillus reuteri]MCC4362401.1 LPXTG cell wall anchor domain-containing protein [Limosilactobacillus reuteri]MCC4365707.1 LPXTG cell wall anchor domain-containing protein [Limosilactobacillus reuteri]